MYSSSLLQFLPGVLDFCCDRIKSKCALDDVIDKFSSQQEAEGTNHWSKDSASGIDSRQGSDPPSVCLHYRSLHYTRCITSKRVTNVGAHHRGIAPAQPRYIAAVASRWRQCPIRLAR